MFQTTNAPIDNELEELVNLKVCEEEHNLLCQIPTAKEIYQTLKLMNWNKAPSLHGYLEVFYLECWDIIGDSIIKAIQSFFQFGYLFKEFNYYYIMLIPKSNQACEFIDFRPISLCNLIYKLIYKILANRMRPILNHIIDPI